MQRQAPKENAGKTCPSHEVHLAGRDSISLKQSALNFKEMCDGEREVLARGDSAPRGQRDVQPLGAASRSGETAANCAEKMPLEVSRRAAMG